MRTVDIRRDRTELRTLIVPGLHGSGPLHWQSLWQEEHPEYERVVQHDWCSADLERWSDAIVAKIEEHSGPVLLVAHSFGCLASVRAASMLPDRIGAALLVAPANPERFGVGTLLQRTRPASNRVLVASRNDPWMKFVQAGIWAKRWSSCLIDAGESGHINAQAGMGAWPFGKRLLARLRHEAICASPLAPASLAA